jgi:hypothetical protein
VADSKYNKTPIVMTEGASREVIFGLDALERRWSLGIGVLGLLLSAIFALAPIKTYVEQKPKNGLCAPGYALVGKMCQKNVLLHFASDPRFYLLLAGALVIMFFTWRKRRVGIIVAALMIGLSLGNFGLPFLALGGWLIIRAFRLQKYGNPTFVGSNQQSRLRAQERSANRKKGVSNSRGKKSDGDPSAMPARPKPAPSKRYTPKQSGRRR